MNNKIIKLNIKPKKITSPGGGSAPLKAPRDLSGHKKIYRFLSGVNFYIGKSAFYLINKKAKSKDKNESSIPAPRSRFVDDIKFIFGENSLYYSTSLYIQKINNLYFQYDLSYAQIKTGLMRLQAIDELLDELNVNDENIEGFYDGIKNNFLEKQKMQMAIQKIAEKKSLRNFSFTKIFSYLSHQDHRFLDLINGSQRISSNGAKEEIVFSSSEYADIALEKLNKINAKIWESNKNSIIYEGVISKESNFELDGVVGINKNWKAIVEKNELEEINQIKNLSGVETIDTIVGVIDGGLPDGVVKNNSYIYEDSVTLGFSNNIPSGTHAEQVASLLMFGKELSKSTNDGLKSPKVAIFNIIKEDTGFLEFKKMVKKVIIKFHNRIKIWNLSLNFEADNSEYEVSKHGLFLDRIQKDYGVIFIISTGNLNNKSNNYISPPSDSFLGISVSAVNEKLEKTSYSKRGRIGVYSFKPDVSIFGGDVNNKITVYSNNKLAYSSGGTSFATPLITRLVANLYELNFSLLEIPAILNAYAAWVAKNNNKIDWKHNPGGVLPINNTELFNLIDEKMMFVSTVNIGESYRNGMFSLKFPTYKGGYDFNFIAAINVDAILAENSTFEYILDSTKIRIGRVDPFTIDSINTNDSKWIYDYSDKNAHAATVETINRIYKGKYKNRDVIISWINRSRASIKTKRGEGISKNIDNWGITFTRDAINPKTRKYFSQDIGIAFIATSENPNFYNHFIHLNNENIIKNSNELNNKIDLSDEIIFQ